MQNFVCPGCSGVISLEDENIGKRVRCTCGQVFVAGSASAAPDPSSHYSTAPQPPVKSGHPESYDASGGHPQQGYPPQGYGQQGYPQQHQPSEQQYFYDQQQANAAAGYGGYGPPKSKVAAGLFGILLGWTGAHNFYLGNTGIAITQLFLFLFGFFTLCFGVGYLIILGVIIWSVIEGILCLTDGKLDSDGRPLV